MKYIDPFEDVWEDEEIDFFEQEIVEINQPGDLSDMILWDGIKIICFDNEDITKLPSLPDSIEYLDCSDTKISFLPKLPKSNFTYDNISLNQIEIIN